MRMSQRPIHQRPRERLLTAGSTPLSDAELLALLLRTGTRELDVTAQSEQLLATFGSLRAIVASSCDQFSALPGQSAARWAMLQAAVEIVRRSLREQLHERDALSSPEALRQFLGLWLRERPRECFVTLFLDSQNRLISAEEMFQGSLTQTAVYPREVARRCLELKACSVVIAHNHPSGVAEPSAADRVLTDALRTTLRVIEVSVLDHMIVAGNRSFSFVEAGMM